MEHVYAALLLNESGTELNERNLTAVLETAGCEASESRTKALVAALEGVDLDEVDTDLVDSSLPAPAEASPPPAPGPESDRGVTSDADPDGHDEPTNGELAGEG